jgi:ABC-2 type transport system permease protein
MQARFFSLVVKELIQFFRDRVMLILILWLYTVEAVMCSMALSFDVKHLSMTIVDFDQTPASRSLKERFLVAEEFKFVGTPASEADAGEWLQSGRAVLALVIPESFARNLERGTKPAVQVLLDASNSNTATIARGYALEVIDLFQRSWPEPSREEYGVAQPVLRVWYNPDLTFTSFMVLSMIGLAAMMVGVIHPASSIVREKEFGTIEQLMVAPFSTAELFFAKTFPTLVMGVLAIFPSLLIVAMFQIPLRGSLVFFLAMTALFLLSAISLGVLIATVTRTLQQALLLSFFGLFPIIYLSGTFVPIESMPRILQNLSLVSPLRYYMDVILGVFLKGAGMTELWPQALALLGIGTILYGASAMAFRAR